MRGRRILILISAIALALSLTGCDLMQTAIGMIPKFSSDVPSVFSGRYAYFEDEADMYSGEYTELLTFDPSNRSYALDSGMGKGSGSYSYSYSSYRITEAYGTLSLYPEGGESVIYSFEFKADAGDGPMTLRLINSSDPKGKTYYHFN